MIYGVTAALEEVTPLSGSTPGMAAMLARLDAVQKPLRESSPAARTPSPHGTRDRFSAGSPRAQSHADCL